MIFLALLVILPWICSSIELDTLLWNASVPFHELCLQLAPPSPYRENYRALVCGSNLPKDEFFSALQRTSLLHLAIVSGSHLVLLEVLLRKAAHTNRLFHRSVFFLLVIYTLATGSQPPAVRAMVTLTLQSLRTRYRLGWRAHQATLFAGLLTWCLFPSWAHSFSFLLSWTASLGLSVFSSEDQQHLPQQWKTHLIIYLLLLPVLLPFGGMHPASVLFNWLLGPILSLAFFPLSLLAFLIPGVSFLTDYMWLGAEALLIFLGEFVPAVDTSTSFTAIQLWPYVFAVHLALHLLDIFKGRIR